MCVRALAIPIIGNVGLFQLKSGRTSVPRLPHATLGAYAAVPVYYGGYAYRSYITGRPTLFPRYYGW